MRLLICEDEKEIREGLSDTIDWADFGISSVRCAADGEEGVALLESFRPDIILTDIKMPRMDGLALCQYVYENHPDIKLILLSGYSDFEYARRAIRYRVENYFLKPVPIGELTELVETLVTKLTDKQKRPAAPDNETTGSLLIHQICEYIDTRYSEAINIESIALEFKRNASYISHIFKKETGIRCSEYLNQVRIRRSLSLLKEREKTLDEVAELCGFSNSAYYITVFKKIMKITPARYRLKSPESR